MIWLSDAGSISVIYAYCRAGRDTRYHLVVARQIWYLDNRSQPI
ncbi:hypothetical protein [Nitrosomonas sp. Nm33]